ncbi:hypothetical protein ACFO5Q_17875 [Kordiimonas lipolytica]|uniref:Uncharacterized protein n=1 Tax=Kordiimonas lipolytica TaxID=1662421 RepID=A0ABV8UFT3_9PROT|nr:hypothetical protein [Kordiimonas lipolytica]
MSNNQNKDGDFLARRRQLLKLGAAGVPMVLTLKASATQPIHSALDCAFVIHDTVKILVDADGKAWMGDGNIREKNGKYKSQDIEQFKNNADYVFPEYTVPERFRPDECETGGGDDDGGRGNDCGWGNDIDDPVGDNDDQDSCNADPPRETPWFEEEGEDGEPGNRPNGYSGNGNDWRHGGGHGGGSGDDDDDGGGNGGWTDCYKVYEIDRNTTITPSDYLNGNGNWSLNGPTGLYLLLAGKYLDTYGNDGGFPGISCLLSILNYLEMQ